MVSHLECVELHGVSSPDHNGNPRTSEGIAASIERIKRITAPTLGVHGNWRNIAITLIDLPNRRRPFQ
jgi:hypothetical protein